MDDQLTQELSIPGLGSLEIKRDDFDDIVEKSIVSSNIQKNPAELKRDELLAIGKNPLINQPDFGFI